MSKEDSMSFLKHLAALRKHLMRACLFILIAAVFAFCFREILFDGLLLAPKSNDFITYRCFCLLSESLNIAGLCINEINIELINSKMSGQFSIHIRLSLIAGLIISAPFVLKELWLFISPGLTLGERQRSVAFISISSILFFMGATFGYFLIVPLSVQFLSNYIVSDQIINLIEMSSYLSTIAAIILACGLLFELPIVVYFLSKYGIVTPDGMKTYRKHAWIVILAISSVITPPDIFSQVIVSIPVAILYELSISISRRAQPNKV
tara:strand:- start:663 stop:1457 length:795 start_codon:yes stop_codon:yes gene_type:complete